MSVVCRRETRILEKTLQHVAGIFRAASCTEDRLFRSPVLADLQELTAKLVELPAYRIDQVKPTRSEQDGPFGALAIQFEQSDALHSAVGYRVYDFVERELWDGFSFAPDNRAVSRIDDSLHAGVRVWKRMIPVETQLVVVRV